MSRELVPMRLPTPLKVTYINDFTGLDKLRDFFARVKESGGVIGFDVETTMHDDFYYRKVRTLQFGNNDEQYVVDLLGLMPYAPLSETAFDRGEKLGAAQGHYGARLTPELQELIDLIAPVLCTKDFTKVGVNLGFEYMSMYWNFGLRTWNFFDCMLAEKAIYAGAHSMKDWHFYSMEEMVARYMGMVVDKELQTSFTIDQPLTQAQIEYAALDTKLPITLRAIQTIIGRGKTFADLLVAGHKGAHYLEHIDPIVLGDDILESFRVENESIGSFQDMHVHGERIDTEKWNARVDRKIQEHIEVLAALDALFIPIVGRKTENITDEQIEVAKDAWRVYNEIPEGEAEVSRMLRRYTREGKFDGITEMQSRLTVLRMDRVAKKEELKLVARDLGKKRTKIKNLAAMCEGEALINYSSGSQVLAVLNDPKYFPELCKAQGKVYKKDPSTGKRVWTGEYHKLESLDDKTMKALSKFPVIALIQRLHKLEKVIGTYGKAWTLQWITKPCKEEGWLHPGDGRLHCVFNQFGAETGRGTSEKPNGQNLERDFDVRSCFIADPPDETIRISCCCDAETFVNSTLGHYGARCEKCGNPCETKPEEMVIVTVDMSGCELRIIAELSGDPIWINAFRNGEDVHSVGTEILYADKWPTLATKPGDIDKKGNPLPPCAYFEINQETGKPKHHKCECPGHKKLRDATKAVNFLLAYGGGPDKLAESIGVTRDEAVALMQLHEKMFPKVWRYLERSGEDAKFKFKSFDMFRGRRLFPKPTQERAYDRAIDRFEEDLRLDEEESKKNLRQFEERQGRRPIGEERFKCTHREPTQDEIRRAWGSLAGSVERQGKNHAIQGTNARIAKIAMGCGHSPDGQPYLWHTLRRFQAKLIKFVHDELVVQCPRRFGEEVAALIGDAFRRAAAEKMKQVIMEFDYHVESYWCK